MSFGEYATPYLLHFIQSEEKAPCQLQVHFFLDAAKNLKNNMTGYNEARHRLNTLSSCKEALQHVSVLGTLWLLGD